LQYYQRTQTGRMSVGKRRTLKSDMAGTPAKGCQFHRPSRINATVPREIGFLS
jgi:hypothetical protein